MKKKDSGLKNRMERMHSKFIIANFVLFSLLLFGCAAEDNEVSTRPMDAVTTKIISFKELNLLPDVPKKAISVQSSMSRLEQSDKYKFSVDTDQILMIEQGKYRAFSFPVIRSKPTGYLENLFLHPYNKGYLAFLLRFDFDKTDMQKLADGIEITDIPRKMHITPLEGFDIKDLNIHDLNYQNVTTDNVGDPVYYNGKCWRVNNVWTNDDGEAMWDMIECPGCGCKPPSGGGGGGGSSGSGGVSMAQYYALVDISGGYWGSSGGGSGGGGGSTNPSTIFNPPPRGGSLNPINGNPIIGIIHPHPSFNITNPCASLADLGDPAKANFANEYSWLKQKVDGTVPNTGERAVSMKRPWIDDVRGYDTFRHETTSGVTADIKTGGPYYAAAHTHPSNGRPMFSFEDVMRLSELYQGATEHIPEFLPDVANMLVCKDPVTGEIITYSIKVDNPAALLLAIENKINLTEGATREDKIFKIMADQGFAYDNCGGNFELSFLRQFAAFGITLYKANDETFTSWTKLYTEAPYSLVFETPC